MNHFIYKTCTTKTKNALQAYCKAINESDGDIFVVMAQKALCLHKLLYDNGLISLKNVYSSTSIDFNKGELDWSNNKVVIIDDIIVSGSALSAATYRLKECGVSTENLEIIAIARDTDYQTLEFTKENSDESILKCAYSLPDDECIELSYEISKLLSLYGIPYDTDYPSYNDIIIETEKINGLYVSPYWESYDVSNENNKEGHVTSLTLFPTKLIKDQIWENFNISLNSIAHMKIRAYIKDLGDKSSLTIVPMVLFNEISHDEIEYLYSYFKDNVFNMCGYGENWSLKTKFRFLQYYFAHLLAKFFLSQIKFQEKLELRSDWLRMQFAANAPIVTKILGIENDNKINAFLDRKIGIQSVPNTFDYIPPKNKTEFSQIDNNENLFDPFRYRHIYVEIPIRNLISEKAKHFTKDYEIIQQFSKRLREGYSLKALLMIFSDFFPGFDVEKLISLFIDRAIDLGIVVPITYHNDDEKYICRAYRHGEDLPFGEADKYRLVYFLKCLDDQFAFFNCGNKLAWVTFEKIIVLFLQMGLRQGNVFNRFLGFENYPVLKERFCVHGAIATVFENEEKDKHVYTEMDSSTWATKWLHDEKLISIDSSSSSKAHFSVNIKNVTNYLSVHKTGNLSEEIATTIETIANIICNWYYYNENKKDVFKDNITAITSCYDQYTFASAIVTELHYFKRYWDNQVQKTFDIILNNDFYESVDFSFSTIEQALNSGRNKHLWYDESRAEQVVEDVATTLKLSQNSNYLFWKKLNICKDNGSIPKLKNVLDEALGYLYFYSTCYEWLVNDQLLIASPEKPFTETFGNAKRYLNIFKTLSKSAKRLDGSIFSIFDDIQKIKNTEERVRELNSSLNNIISYCEDTVINEIEKIIEEKSETYTINYESCFILDLETDNDKASDSLLYKIWNLLDEDINKTKLNIIYFGCIENKYQRYGVFFEDCLDNTQKISDSYLFDIFLKIKAMAKQNLYATRTIFIPVIPKQITMKHNTKSHLCSYTQSFSNVLLNEVSKQFNNNALDQLLLIKTRNCAKSATQTFKTFFESKSESVEIKNIAIPEKLSAILFYTKEQIFSENEYDYSTVGILEDAQNTDVFIGTGLLITYKSSVYCITCKHLVKQETLYAKIKGTNIVFKINLINTNQQKDQSIKTAQDEIAIFRPSFDENSLINRNGLLSENNFICNLNEIEDMDFKMFGYAGSKGRYVSPIRYNGIVEGNFYALNAPKNSIKGGFSGAGVISGNKLLGLHSQHENEELIDIVPISIILEELKKIYNEEIK